MQDKLNGEVDLLADYSLSLRLDTEQFNVLKPIDYTETLNSLSSGLTSLETTVSTLSTKIDAIQVVLDSGALVGAIGPQIDSYLGQTGFYASRNPL